MKQYTVRYTLMITERQDKSLEVLRSKNVNISQFIRQAIKEKIGREWNMIREKNNKTKCPY